MTPAELMILDAGYIDRALEVLRERGHHQGSLVQAPHRADSPVCGLAAIRVAVHGNPYYGTEVVERVANRVTPGQKFTHINDRPRGEHTKRRMRRKMRKTAKQLRHDGTILLGLEIIATRLHSRDAHHHDLKK